MTSLFSDHYDAFRRFRDELASYPAQGDEDRDMVRLATAAAETIDFHRDEYDQLTPLSTKTQASALLEAIKPPLDPKKLRRAVLSMAGFIREKTLARDSRSAQEQLVLDYFIGADLPASADEWNGYHVDYIRYTLPRRIFESRFHELVNLKNEFSKLQTDTYRRADELEQRIGGYRSELEKMSTDYNFVGWAGRSTWPGLSPLTKPSPRTHRQATPAT